MTEIVSTLRLSERNIDFWRSQASRVIDYAYSDLGSLIDTELQVGDDFTTLVINNELVSFFTTRFLDADQECTFERYDTYVYFGLSGTLHTSTHRGHRTICVTTRLNELREISSKRVAAIASTAFPPTYFLAEATCDGIFPNRAGNMSEAEYKVFTKLLNQIDCDHKAPKMGKYVLEGVSSARYTQDQVELSMESIDRLPVLARSGLKESNGDRLFFMCELTGKRFG